MAETLPNHEASRAAYFQAASVIHSDYEQRRVYWDFSWVWGPPEDHLAKLLRAVGSERFVYGTQWPLRLTQNPRANLDLLPPDLASLQLGDPTQMFAV